VLVVGSIHGNETAGHAVVRRLRRFAVPAGVQLWTLMTANPDGVARGTRQNVHGVDLNRNFPYRWRRQGVRFSPFYSGPSPLSEPESRAVRRLVWRIRPHLTIWYHQALRLVDLGSGADPAIVRSYARRVGLPARTIGFLPGVATRWQNRRFPKTSAFVVELPGGRLTPRAAERHARAVLSVARSQFPIAHGTSAPVETVAAHTQPPRSAGSRRPRIVSRSIPFGAKRKAEMAAYARRHYGLRTYRLIHPHVIVIHFTETRTFQSTYNTFAPDVPDSELHELPGTCAHFVIDRDGTIYQLVPISIMCRHTVGLNWTAIGIEHVGFSDAEVLGDRSQMRASLRLVRWLRCRFRIKVRDVIGHNESLSSPYHREKVPALQHQTHADFKRADMQVYRRHLAETGACGE
jgi:N-acetylmuramoyl-L-alanine amidase